MTTKWYFKIVGTLDVDAFVKFLTPSGTCVLNPFKMQRPSTKWIFKRLFVKETIYGEKDCSRPWSANAIYLPLPPFNRGFWLHPVHAANLFCLSVTVLTGFHCICITKVILNITAQQIADIFECKAEGQQRELCISALFSFISVDKICGE